MSGELDKILLSVLLALSWGIIIVGCFFHFPELSSFGIDTSKYIVGALVALVTSASMAQKRNAKPGPPDNTII